MKGSLIYLVWMLTGILGLGGFLLLGAAAAGFRKGGLRGAGKVAIVGLLVYGICLAAFMGILILTIGYPASSNWRTTARSFPWTLSSRLAMLLGPAQWRCAMRQVRNTDRLDRFLANQQASPRLPVGDEREARAPGRPRREGTRREARPQRPVSLRIRAPLSRAVACDAGSTTGHAAGTFFRE